jgi:hypothetical protein
MFVGSRSYLIADFPVVVPTAVVYLFVFNLTLHNEALVWGRAQSFLQHVARSYRPSSRDGTGRVYVDETYSDVFVYAC